MPPPTAVKERHCPACYSEAWATEYKYKVSRQRSLLKGLPCIQLIESILIEGICTHPRTIPISNHAEDPFSESAVAHAVRYRASPAG